MAREGATSGRSGAGSVSATKVKGTVSTPAAPKGYGNPFAMQSIAGTSHNGVPAGVPAAPVYRPPAAYAPAPAYGGGGGGFAAPAAAPPRMSEEDWLKGDSQYLEQENEYNRALSEFESRIGKKKKNFEDDYKQSEGVTNQNKAQSLQGLGEDFAARGMSYSGVFDSARTNAEDTFKRQLANLLTVKTRNDAQAEDDLADYKSENTLSRGNSKRNALARFANSQSLA